jgi:hypothetical protein
VLLPPISTLVYTNLRDQFTLMVLLEGNSHPDLSIAQFDLYTVKEAPRKLGIVQVDEQVG